jgi:hypothetical protein
MYVRPPPFFVPALFFDDGAIKNPAPAEKTPSTSSLVYILNLFLDPRPPHTHCCGLRVKRREKRRERVQIYKSLVFFCLLCFFKKFLLDWLLQFPWKSHYFCLSLGIRPSFSDSAFKQKNGCIAAFGPPNEQQRQRHVFFCCFCFCFPPLLPASSKSPPTPSLLLLTRPRPLQHLRHGGGPAASASGVAAAAAASPRVSEPERRLLRDSHQSPGFPYIGP